MAQNKPVALLTGAALALVACGGFALYETQSAHRAEERSQQLEQSVNATNAQLQLLSQKLEALTAPKPTPSPSPTTHSASVKHARHRAPHVRKDDPRFNKLQAQLDDQGRLIAGAREDLDSTRSDLTNAKAELGNGIARNHGEIVMLQRKGERNYYEFDLNKSKQFASEGPMAIKLKKANVKHQFADLDLMVDDHTVSKKHVNLLEPTSFYSTDSDQPVMIVINNIGKDHIHGYVSAPKYRRADLSAAAADNSDASGNATTASADAPAVKPRQKLSLPR